MLETAKSSAAEQRSIHARAEAALEGFEREVRLRQERIQAIGAEQALWQKRIANAREQIATLRAREEETSADLAALANLPAEIEQRRSKLLDAIAAAERERSKAADDLALAETALKRLEKALREVQERLAGARENRARTEARLESARERRAECAHTVREQLDCAPEACLSLAALKPNAPIPPLVEVEARLAKLKADRERLGGVNLRAEEEEAELSAKLEEMEREKADVEEAIVRLRQGISNLNREGRKRLLEAFDTVNGHFQRLFKTLFGGGSAELKLVDSDDPLESGLEILACPPGKRPQVLTLLSGGEKALTALALIFAVFLTNPSPICVLDEVDAPLDDANVDRFCLLMEEMARSTDTRFLIITHHPLTMSRMSRLFGVTMAERGVSSARLSRSRDGRALARRELSLALSLGAKPRANIMDPRWVNLLLFLAVLVACSIAFALLLPVVWEHFKGARGGWGALARAYATTEKPTGEPGEAVNRRGIDPLSLLRHRGH